MTDHEPPNDHSQQLSSFARNQSKRTIKITPAFQPGADGKMTAMDFDRYAPGQPGTPISSRILGRDAKTRTPTAITEHQDHRWLKGQYFCTLPITLLDRIQEILPDGLIDPEDWKVERDLSIECCEKKGRVGTWGYSFINYNKLRPSSTIDLNEFIPEGQSAADLIAEMGWDTVGINPALFANESRAVRERSESPFLQATFSYPGWLMTNQVFLAERDELLRKFERGFLRWGTARFTLVQPAGVAPEDTTDADRKEWFETQRGAQEFLARWRLLSLAAPDLPDPQGPLSGNGIPPLMHDQLRQTGGLLFLPDTLGLPSRDELREMLADTLHRDVDHSHLTEWRSLIDLRRSDRGAMRKFHRWLRLQHYWRILHRRHPQIFAGNLVKLRSVMAKFLDVTEATIKNDLPEIESRAGQGWETRVSPLENH